jgi:hypothetical protein
VLSGWGAGEMHLGAYVRCTRVSPGLTVPKPKRLQGWARLAKALDVKKLAGKTKARSWKEVAELATHIRWPNSRTIWQVQ